MVRHKRHWWLRSGTVAGCATRRYHGILLAALQPPVARTQLVAALDETIDCGGTFYELATHKWASGAIAPQGLQYIESFHLDGTIPTWIYAIGDARLEKRIWMRQGENTTYVRYALLNAVSPVEFQAKVLVIIAIFMALLMRAIGRMRVESLNRGIGVLAYDGATPFIF